MSIQSPDDIAGLKRVGQVVVHVLQTMQAALKPGITTAELDEIGREVLAQYNAQSAPIFFYDYPAATCISVNHEAAHGIPGKRVVQDGDLVNIDVSAVLDGYVADTGASIPVGEVSPVAKKLCAATQEALLAALKVAKAGNRMDEVRTAVEKVARKNRFNIIENLAGHGVGRHIHEAPEFVPDYTRKKDRRRFQKGMVLTLEPFLTTGGNTAEEQGDGWTLALKPGELVAQYEHTIIITEREPILTTAGANVVAL
ncbi:MAG TPA: type I methionyl aminopeptidase [Caldilineaceae bacterium]|nr:type I methionyl aminopeptidase [Caldilineaceae bacterium]